MAHDLTSTAIGLARWMILVWMSLCYQMEQTSSSSSFSSSSSRPGAIIYDRQLTVGGSSRDCTRLHISRTPSREAVYMCCEGWKLQKNKCIPDAECFSMPLGQDYHGFVNKTIHGRSCIPWTSHRIRPHLNVSMVITPLIDHGLVLGASNCRNPWSDRPMPWCFVEARPHSDVITWEFCDVGKPRSTCNMAKNYRVRCGEVTCNRGQVCDEPSQSCGCRPGYQGPKCDHKCEEGRYGVNCHGLCSCSHHEVCHHITGTCSSSEDDSDVDETMNPLRPYDRLPPGNGTAMCRSSCGILSKIGCTCSLDGGTCKCPGYVIALFVVSITTWITLGGVCVVCSIRRRRYKSKIEYKRDSDYCEELDSDDETELGTNSTQPTTVTTTSEINTTASDSSHSPPSLPPPPPPPASSSPSSSSSASPSLRPPDTGKHHVRFAGSTSPHLRHSPPSDPPVPEPADSRSLESSTSSDDSHVYLNVDREDSIYSIDYSHPYEFLNQDGENGILGCNGEEHLEMSPECFLLQYMVQRQMKALNNAPHGYVNDSVAKWQDRNISKRLFPFGQAPFPINSNTPAAVVVGAAATRSRNEAREILQAAFKRNGKPTIKPKPDVLKLAPVAKKSGPHQRLIEKSESLESESEPMFINGCNLTNGTNTRNNNADSRNDSNSNPKATSCQHIRPVVQKRAGTVPSPTKRKDNDDDDGEDIFSFSDDHIYENSQIRKPCYRFAKSRSTDQLNSC